MKETAEELTTLQALLDHSGQGRTRHLTDIVGPARRLPAEWLSANLVGLLVLNVATVSALGEPRLSAVDGQFLHGHWYFSTAAAAFKDRHLAVRPRSQRRVHATRPVRRLGTRRRNSLAGTGA